MERIVPLLGLAFVLAACGEPADATPGSAEVAAEAVSGRPLEQVLGGLEARLDSALAEGLGSASVRRLAEAESITDHLIETGLPFAWLGESGYSVEARLRQIQAQADRVLAQVRGGTDRATLAEDVQALRDRVRRLRQDLGGSGVPAPVPVADLLRALDTLRR